VTRSPESGEFIGDENRPRPGFIAGLTMLAIGLTLVRGVRRSRDLVDALRPQADAKRV